MLTELKQVYMAHLKENVYFGGKARSRVRYPEKWEAIEPSSKSGEFVDLVTTDKTVYIWSDQHFGHANIIDFCDRPYMNVAEMNENLLANYQDIVTDDDICIWLGDVGFKTPKQDIAATVAQCPGYNIHVVGNHDFHKKKLLDLPFDETHLMMHLQIDELDLVLTHYPLYDNLPSPMINIHGHKHQTISDHDRCINVSVEVPYINYKPTPLNDIIDMARTRYNSLENNNE